MSPRLLPCTAGVVPFGPALVVVARMPSALSVFPSQDTEGPVSRLLWSSCRGWAAQQFAASFPSPRELGLCSHFGFGPRCSLQLLRAFVSDHLIRLRSCISSSCFCCSRGRTIGFSPLCVLRAPSCYRIRLACVMKAVTAGQLMCAEASLLPPGFKIQVLDKGRVWPRSAHLAFQPGGLTYHSLWKLSCLRGPALA